MDVLYLFTFFICLVFSIEAKKIMIRFPKNKAAPPGTQTRIYGGTPAKENEFPYTLFVLIKTNAISSCTASLIKVDKVLLAAHCVIGNVSPSNVIMAAGKPDLTEYMAYRLEADFAQSVNEANFGIQERRADAIYTSNSFRNPNTLEHDLAIISVKNPFVLSNSVSVIPIATDKLVERKRCTILGWGLTEGQKMSPVLLFSPSAYVVPLEDCQYKKSGPFICLAKSRSGICQGDSGSPLVCDGKVYGVASHVLASSSSDDCGNDVEEVYAELYDEQQWINSQLIETPEEIKTEKPKDVTGGAKKVFNNAFISIIISSSFLLF